MDAETIRLIITAAAAVVAGIGAATLTAVINRKNTKDTLASAREVAEEQRREMQNREHAVWVRDQKQEAYTNFLLLAQNMRQKIFATAVTETLDVNRQELEVERSRIMLVGTPVVRHTALAINQNVTLSYDLHTFICKLNKKRSELTSEEHTDQDRPRVENIGKLIRKTQKEYWDTREDFFRLTNQFVMDVRDDLGTVSPEDEALNAANRERIKTIREDLDVDSEEEDGRIKALA
ncbi:hypothetical protein F8G81_07550 [Arthrobacter sp. CDRTa11]|uniref:hypothetical protein n=1 Tax=Arthrobacter sp. CDRTa11 TaxID=2651199 RepID=UPI002265B6E6|nr:hypothetical protein [Arthrobacter sp. CDRTa11]UZX02488.1 hypothetical protein F8G81_07550 [Arthrobacter sp. CDRTa11]